MWSRHTSSLLGCVYARWLADCVYNMHCVCMRVRKKKTQHRITHSHTRNRSSKNKQKYAKPESILKKTMMMNERRRKKWTLSMEWMWVWMTVSLFVSSVSVSVSVLVLVALTLSLSLHFSHPSVMYSIKRITLINLLSSSPSTSYSFRYPRASAHIHTVNTNRNGILFHPHRNSHVWKINHPVCEINRLILMKCRECVSVCVFARLRECRAWHLSLAPRCYRCWCWCYCRCRNAFSL